ncbi:MAG: glycosyltransferase family 4 protein, partial [Candidatus Hadarchaeales archaeon]
MRILYITEIYPDPNRGIGVWGGGERNFYEISRRIAAKGHEVTILTCRFPGQHAEEIFEGVKIYREGLSREPYTGSARKTDPPIISYILKSSKKTLDQEPDIIHCNTYFPVYSGSIATKV